MTDIALLPCPFCGTKPAPPFQNLRDDDDLVKCWTIQHPCTAIDHEIWTHADASADDCVTIWNTRAVPARQEPVAWRTNTGAATTEKRTAEIWRDTYNFTIEPLYAAPVTPPDLAEDCAKIAEGREIGEEFAKNANWSKVSEKLIKIADAASYEDGTDTPLGQQVREGAHLIRSIDRIASLWDYRIRVNVRKDYPLLAEAIDKLVGGLDNE